MISLDLREHVQRWIYFFGAYEADTVQWFRSMLRPGLTMLDIGAHVGQYSLIAGAAVTPTGRVHSFEPNPASFRRLSTNLALNGFPHARAHPMALSNTTGSTTLYVPKSDNQGEASLQACVPGSDTATIRSMTADQWMETADLGTPPRVDLIKIDVQGFELRVVEGAQNLLRRFRPTILCEFEDRWLRLAGTSSVELKRAFRDLGYSVNRIGKNGLEPVGMDEVHGFDNLVLTPVGAASNHA
jgi:FkbM family methyltransferase